MVDPDLNRNAKNYRYNHKYKDAVEITLHFINIKELKYAYKQNGIKLARVMVAYLIEEMWQLHASELVYNEAQGHFYYLRIRENPKHPKP